VDDNVNSNLFIKSIFDVASEKREEEREFMKKIVELLYKNEVISKNNVIEGINNIISESSMIAPDVPQN